mgnify:CR=1 FL=1
MGISDFLFDDPLARIETVGLFWFSSNELADSEIDYLILRKATKYLAAVRESRIVVRVSDSVDK